MLALASIVGSIRILSFLSFSESSLQDCGDDRVTTRQMRPRQGAFRGSGRLHLTEGELHLPGHARRDGARIVRDAPTFPIQRLSKFRHSRLQKFRHFFV